MSIRKACDLETSTGWLIGYVELRNSQQPGDADDMPLATDALVFMVVGLAVPWKMPFGYIPNAELSGVVLKNLVLEAIGYMHKCRLTVVCGCLGAKASLTWGRRGSSTRQRLITSRASLRHIRRLYTLKYSEVVALSSQQKEKHDECGDGQASGLPSVRTLFRRTLLANTSPAAF